MKSVCPVYAVEIWIPNMSGDLVVLTVTKPTLTLPRAQVADEPASTRGEGTIKSQAPTTYDGSTCELATRTVAWRKARAGRVVANPL